MHLFRIVTIVCFLLCLCATVFAQELPQFDFSRLGFVSQWNAAHDISKIESGAEGMVISIGGNDPYTFGPPRDYPANVPLWLTVRMKSDTEGDTQIFYFTDGPREENSVRFTVPQNQWTEKRIAVPPLAKGTRLRLDPPGTKGQATIAFMRFSPRILLQEPAWPRPTTPDVQQGAYTLKSGNLIIKSNALFGQFTLAINGQDMAIGLNCPQIGYTVKNGLHWLDFSQKRHNKWSMETDGTIRIRHSKQDEDGAYWGWTQTFKAGKLQGTIEVHSEVTVSQNREIVFLPMLTILPGVGSFGEKKTQAIFPGLEYLDNEPSSSEADIRGPQSKRQVSDSVKNTLPMMAVQNGENYIGLAWREDEKNPDKFSALFDSPDRLFGSGGHVMGLLFPGSDGENRVEGSLLPYQGETLKAGVPLTLNALIFGGKGDSAVDAVKQFVAWHGLPKIPDAGTFENYNALASAGWLDSKIREGNLFRHAFWPGFEAKTAADAPLLMEWLAQQNSPRAGELKTVAQSALAQVKPQDYNASNVSHVTYPVAALVYGGVEQNAARAAQNARNLLKRFDENNRVLYQKRPDGGDLGTTHFAPDANGLTAQVVESLLENASFSGEQDLIDEGLKKLRALDKFRNTVPRGAQTWEVPLHTPDILASAHLVAAYTRGYELTGEAHFLEMARHWAWTGVPFVYLRNPTDKNVGAYSTIAVLGATQWAAPVWFGQPVQWCGLVYADALYRLAPYDQTGPWKTLADGITAAGIQHTWKQKDKERVGLLPDYYLLRPQMSSGPAINPGTMQTNAVRLFNKPALYDFRVLSQSGLLVHAPGAISEVKESKTGAQFKVMGWTEKPYFVLINGLKSTPQIRINNQAVTLAAPHQFNAEKGRLILNLQGAPTVEISTN